MKSALQHFPHVRLCPSAGLRLAVWRQSGRPICNKVLRLILREDSWLRCILISEEFGPKIRYPPFEKSDTYSYKMTDGDTKTKSNYESGDCKA